LPASPLGSPHGVPRRRGRPEACSICRHVPGRAGRGAAAAAARARAQRRVRQHRSARPQAAAHRGIPAVPRAVGPAACAALGHIQPRLAGERERGEERRQRWRRAACAFPAVAGWGAGAAACSVTSAHAESRMQSQIGGCPVRRCSPPDWTAAAAQESGYGPAQAAWLWPFSLIGKGARRTAYGGAAGCCSCATVCGLSHAVAVCLHAPPPRTSNVKAPVTEHTRAHAPRTTKASCRGRAQARDGADERHRRRPPRER